MMILATLRNAGKTDTYIFNSSAEYSKVINDPENEILYELPFGLTGKTYEEKKAALAGVAFEFSTASKEEIHDLSMNELNIIFGWFERNGKRYGLLNEFRENAIC